MKIYLLKGIVFDFAEQKPEVVSQVFTSAQEASDKAFLMNKELCGYLEECWVAGLIDSYGSNINLTYHNKHLLTDYTICATFNLDVREGVVLLSSMCDVCGAFSIADIEDLSGKRTCTIGWLSIKEIELDNEN